MEHLLVVPLALVFLVLLLQASLVTLQHLNQWARIIKQVQFLLQEHKGPIQDLPLGPIQHHPLGLIKHHPLGLIQLQLRPLLHLVLHLQL